MVHVLVPADLVMRNVLGMRLEPAGQQELALQYYEANRAPEFGRDHVPAGQRDRSPRG